MNGDPDRMRSGHSDPITLSRRQIMGVAAIGLGGTAGCVDFDEIAPTDPTLEVDGPAWHASFNGLLAEIDLGQPSGLLARFAYDNGFVRDPETRKPINVLASSFEETESTVSITLHDGLEWSNGDPLTAIGLGRWMYMHRMGSSGMRPPGEIRSGNARPRNGLEAVTDIEWDDRTVTVSGSFDVVRGPLSEMSMYIGRRPRTYYDRVWEAFQEAFDDDPWADEAVREAVTAVVDGNIWRVDEEYLPSQGIVLENESAGAGVEAAYSGIWYPSRTEGTRLYFSRNDSHPFADRVDLETMIWTFQEDPETKRDGLQRGIVDGGMITNATDEFLQTLSDEFTIFEGQGDQITGVTLNHGTSYFGERDVRAALMYVIDRDHLGSNVDRATTKPISVPGADLQSDHWVSNEFRKSLRSYNHDLERATTLLEGVGFRRDSGDWVTPDGDSFDLELLTSESAPAAEYTIAEQWESFGIDVTVRSIEATSYQTRLGNRTFRVAMNEWWCPSAAGRRWNRAGEYVGSILRGEGFPYSEYLVDDISSVNETSTAITWAGGGVERPRILEYESAKDLKSITVDAPPLGEPDGSLQEWPYLYHVARLAAERDPEKLLEHARACTWVYNYQLPVLELLAEAPLIALDSDSWTIPDASDPVWKFVEDRTQPGGVWAALAWGHINAD